MVIDFVQPDDQTACNDFHNRIHHDCRLMAQWRWEFAGNTYGQAPIPFICAKDGDRVVGTQAFIPIRMIDRKGEFWTAKSEETLVDPEYRGQQVFEKMYELLFRYAEDHQFAFIWGFTPAVKAFTRLKFDTPGVTQQLFLPFSSRSATPMIKKLSSGQAKVAGGGVRSSVIRSGVTAARLLSAVKFTFGRRGLPAGLVIRTMEEPDEQAGLVCESFVKQWGGCTIYRDSRYLRWRLFENPYVRSIVRAIYEGDRLLGWVAFTLGDDGVGYLVDVFVSCDPSRWDPGRLVRSLLIDAVLSTRNMGATGIRGWSVNKHPFDRLVCSEARKIGFYHIRRGHSVVLYTCAAGRDRLGAENFDEWFVSRIYTEGVLS